jgi:cell division protease FtsH
MTMYIMKPIYLLSWLCILNSTSAYYLTIPKLKKHINVIQTRKYPLSRKYYTEYIERVNQTNGSKSHQYSFWLKEYNDNAVSDDEEEQEEERVTKQKPVDETDILGNAIMDMLGSFSQWIQPSTLESESTSLELQTSHIFIPLTEEEADDIQNKQFSKGIMGDVTKRKAKMQSSKKIKDVYLRSQSQQSSRSHMSSENFKVSSNSQLTFKDIGGYQNIKEEMLQTFDILTNYSKYKGYNVRIPKGLILEGPPGNGKTMLAKGISGETKIPCIVASGSEFQEKYIGVGSAKVRELFDLAKKNKPCIIFIDEIDAIGRARSSDGESSSGERDSTLNELLVAMDGFNTESEIFVMGATNRIDLLDAALVRPGRIDKKIYVGNPDKITREQVINIHIQGKPYDETMKMEELIDITEGLSCSEIENLLNEAMLYALRENRPSISKGDIDIIYNKMLTGWQSTEQEFTNTTIHQICIHEIGHVIMSLHSREHPKFRKVSLNLHSPSTPGFTLFEKSSELKTMNELREHIMILLAGRIAEEMFYGNASVSTGAVNDFNEALKVATTMVTSYGADTNYVYSSNSNKYTEKVDDEVNNIIKNAYTTARDVMKSSYDIIQYISFILHNDVMLTYSDVIEHIKKFNPDYLNHINNINM